MSDNSFAKDIIEITERAQVHEINGEFFSSTPLYHVRHKDSCETLHFGDLSSLVPILKREIREYDIPIYIVVDSYKSVCVVTAMDVDRERERAYSVECSGTSFSFGRVYGYEDFVIALRSMFVQNEDSEKLLAVLKRITDSNTVSVEDDGVTQRVTASKGIMAGGQAISPIQRLAPYRTFTEIEQPTSEFLFRIKDGGGFALYEADGGAWKLEAKKRIKEYYAKAFEKEITDGTVIILS